jgi:hypothetical protein
MVPAANPKLKTLEESLAAAYIRWEALEALTS